MPSPNSRGNGSKSYNNSSRMQEEAIGMVGKVEEWLRPHSTFETELSWTDGAMDPSASEVGICSESAIESDISQHVRSTSCKSSPSTIPTSTVTVKSTAITSLTIPKIPSGILHTTVPSAFLVKRLGATLTSKALEICLPRFLRQLERDYYRWSGLDFALESKESRKEDSHGRGDGK